MEVKDLIIIITAILLVGFLIQTSKAVEQRDITQCLIKTDDNMEVNCFYEGGGR